MEECEKADTSMATLIQELEIKSFMILVIPTHNQIHTKFNAIWL